ncbi:MAG: putative Ig domain-containing protein [Nanoarchaeota archaeon]
MKKNKLKLKRNRLISIVLLLIFLNLTFGIAKQDYEAVQIIDNGNALSHIDLVFIGSGFNKSEISDFANKTEINIEKTFSVNWFGNNTKLFNIWRIDAISNQSGIDFNTSEINSIISNSQIPNDIIIVLHNYHSDYETYNGNRIDLFKNSHNYVVLAHELGHVIGKLGDEYYGDSAHQGACNNLSKWFVNVHDKNSPEKWSELISASPYEGAYYCSKNLWRPSENTIMRDSANTAFFDAIGSKAMDLGAGKIIGSTESLAPNIEILGVSDNEIVNGLLYIEANVSDSSGIERVEFYWARAGEPSSSIKLDKTFPYDISIDTTKYSDGKYFLDTFVYDKNWNYKHIVRSFNISNPSEPFKNSLNIPIIIQEALIHDSDFCQSTYNSASGNCQHRNLSGKDRIEEPLTVGIPLSEESEIKNLDQLGLIGTDNQLQQFRPLAYWSNGNIKWILVDTQITLPAESSKTIYLVNGGGNSGGNNLASEFDDYILIDTGNAQFQIRKKNFNLFDQVIVDGNLLVSSGNSGGLSITGYENTSYKLYKDNSSHILKENEIYYSKNDANSTAVIEENGPVRAVVKATGSFKDSSENRFMDYTIRFHFYKNKSYVKTIVIMRHSQEEIHSNVFGGYNQEPRKFSNFQITIPTNLRENKQFLFSTKNASTSGLIDSSAYMFQGFSMSKMKSTIEQDHLGGNDGWINPPMERVNPAIKNTNYTQSGLEIKNGNNLLRSLGNNNDWSRGFASINDSFNNAIGIAFKYLSAYWPASISLDNNGTIEIGIFSKYNSKKNIIMGWGTHETREIILDFHSSEMDVEKLVYLIEQPLVGRSSFEQYKDSKVLYGQEELISAEQMENWWLNNHGKIEYGIPTESWKHYNIGVLVWRVFWYSGVEGTDWPLNYFFGFLKTGMGGRYMSGLQKTIFNSDSAVRRTDDFDYSKSKIKSDYKYIVNETGSYNSGGGQNHFDYYGHIHWRGMPFYYYATGNEEIKEAILDYMEEFKKSGANAYPLFESDLRGYSRYYATLGLGYEFTQEIDMPDEKLLELLKIMTGSFLDSRNIPPNSKPFGRNLERGYIWLNMYYRLSHVHSFMLYTIHAEDVWQGLRVIKEFDPSYPRIEEVEDYLLGIAQFTYNEPYRELGGDNFGYIYDYFLYVPLNNDPTKIYKIFYSENNTYNLNNFLRKDDSSRLMLLAYQKTGESKYFERGRKLLADGGGTPSSNPFAANELIYNDIYGDKGVWTYLDTFATNNSGNDYQISFIVPENARTYQIKFSDKPIVDWLGFKWTEIQHKAEYDFFFIENNFTFIPNNSEKSFILKCVDGIPKCQLNYSNGKITDWNGDIFTEETYEYSPDNYTAFFAAWNIDDEPLPLNSGEEQDINIDLESEINEYNAKRNLNSSNPSYIHYDSNKKYYFSIKYYTEGLLPLMISTYSIPYSKFNESYSSSISASGGKSPYAWTNLSEMPKGLSFNNQGIIYGIPSEVGVFNFTIKVTDANGNITSKEFSLKIDPKGIDSNSDGIVDILEISDYIKSWKSKDQGINLNSLISAIKDWFNS